VEQVRPLDFDFADLKRKLVHLVDTAFQWHAPAKLGDSRARAAFVMSRRLPTMSAEQLDNLLFDRWQAAHLADAGMADFTS
jgi:hypothetical protein